MISINSYIVTERAVYEGVGLGVSKLLENVENFKNPSLVVESIAAAVMSELCDTMDFGQQPVRFTPDLIRKMWQTAQDEAAKETPSPSPK